jgi:predicted Zn-dependent protease
MPAPTANDLVQTDPPATTLPAKSMVATSTTAPAEPLKAKYDVRLIGQRDVGNGVNFYSLDREMAVGRDMSKQVEAVSKLVTDPVVTEYVNRIGQNLVRNSDARVPFTIKVLDNEEVNAFALPGGYFYVDTGLILAADNEAELAAVMAHEIAHVAARHATKNMTKSQIWNMASIPLIFVGGPAGYAIAEIASIAVPMTFLKFSRDAEREADLLGLEYDYAAGYDPQAFVQFFEKLNADEKQKHSKLAKMFSTHPMTADRVTAAQEEIRHYLPDRDSYVVSTSEFDQVKARLLAMENTHNIGGGDSRRPVLLKRTGASTDADVNADAAPPQNSGSSASTQTKDDNGRPTLKRNPQQDQN